jgi:hypothetical protein
MTWHQLFGRLFYPPAPAHPSTLHSVPGALWDAYKMVIPYVVLAIFVLDILSDIAARISPRYREWLRKERREELEELEELMKS